MITVLSSLRQIDQVKAILFDVNGTLRIRENHPPTQNAAYERILKILGKTSIPETYWSELEARYKAYGKWAQEKLVQLTESEIWTQWMLPEEPANTVSANASELMLAWSERKGRVLPKPETEDVLKELSSRGYRLGLISNTMSTLDIPGFVERFGWSKYIDVVLLSAFEKVRKPSPVPFNKAAVALDLDPTQCTYVGNKFSKDIVGCKRAGYPFGIIIRNQGKPLVDEECYDVAADIVIDSLNDLMKVFPDRAN